MDERHLTVADVAELLSCTPHVVRQLIRSGDLPGSFRLGRGAKVPWRIPVSAIEQFIAARRAATEAAS